MKKLIIFLIIVLLVFGFAPITKPTNVKADYTKPEFIDITPDATRITNMPDWFADHAAYVNVFITTSNSVTHTIRIDTKGQTPKVAVAVGTIESWSYNSTPDELGRTIATINAKSTYRHAMNKNEQDAPNFLMVALALDLGDGPEEATGLYVSFNGDDWEMIPPTQYRGRFGYKITGATGTKGWFKMFMPNALVEKMGFKKGEIAGFIDGDQASINVTDLETGVMISLSGFTYSTHTIYAGKALPLSLAASKKSIKSGKTTKLFGWSKTKKKGKKISLYKKEKGESAYTLVEELITGKKGYFSKKLSLSTTTSFKALYVNKKGKKTWSPVKKVKVK